MRLTRFLVSLVSVSLATLGCATHTQQHATEASDAGGTIAIRNVDVLTMTSSQLRRQQTLLIRNGAIAAIGDAGRITIPRSAQIIDGSGKTLMPGLGDSHGHLPSGEPDQIPMDDYLFLNLACGVTTVRAMRGNADQLQLAHQIAKGEREGPTLYVSSPPITQPLDAATARATFAAYKKDGYPFIKYLQGANTEQYDILVAAAKEQGLRFMGHAPAKTSLEHVIAAGQCDIEHAGTFIRAYQKDPKGTDAAIEAMGRQRVAHSPNLVWYLIQYNQRSLEELGRVEGLGYLSPALVATWTDEMKAREAKSDYAEIRAKWKTDLALYSELLAKMNRAGVPLLISPTDAEFVVPGFSMLDEMDLFLKAGVPPYDILRAATVNLARSLGESDWGTIEPGKRADLLLLANDPLQDIRNLRSVEGVMVRGQWIDKTTIAHRLELMRKPQ